MKDKTRLFSRTLFILTLAFHTTASIVLGVKLLVMDSPSINENTFNGTLYWVIVIVTTTWYTYSYGFMNARHLKYSRKRVLWLITVFSFPLIVGFSTGFVAYYIIYVLLVIFVKAYPYVTVFLLGAGLFTVMKTLSGVYFGFREVMSPSLRKTTIWFALIVAFGLLLAALLIF